MNYGNKQCTQMINGSSAVYASDAPARSQYEVPGYLERLAVNLSDVEQSVSELRARLGIVTRPDNEKEVAGPAPEAVPNTEMGNIVRSLASRVGALDSDIRSLIHRLEV